MTSNLKKETVHGVIWSAVEKFSTVGVLFIANIVLARILTPKDFGLLAVITIFVQIAQTLIDSGFSNALIQKKDRNQVDYSTVFFFNLFICIILYIILYVSSPLIAKFFENEQLISLTRVVGLNFVIGALVSVHRTRLTVELEFKKQSIITLTSALIAAIISIYLAYKGLGVWALVCLSLINISLQTLLFYFCINWHPSLIFSVSSFRNLFAYSSNLLGASLIHLLYRNIYPILIGKKFSPVVLGYFNRADSFAMYVPQTISQIVSRVSFPIFSRLQDDNIRLRSAYSKYIILTSLIIFPLIICLIILAKPLTILILKEKWLPMVPMLQILCIDWMTDHICSINLNVLYVKGRSDLALRLEVVKKIIGFMIFIISLYWGIIGVCWGRVLYSFIAVYLNAFYTNRLIGLSLGKQIGDIIMPLLMSVIMGAFVLITSNLAQLYWNKIVVGMVVGFITYASLLFIFHRQIIKEVISLIRM